MDENSSSSSSSSSEEDDVVADLRARLRTQAATIERREERIAELESANGQLMLRVTASAAEVTTARNAADVAVASLQTSQKQLDSITSNLRRGWSGSVPRGGLKKFLEGKGATPKVRTLCTIHVANLSSDWWKHMKLLPNNWQQFSILKDTIPARMMYDLRESATGEMPVIIEWYWWIMPLTSMTMKGYRNAKTTVCHDGWKGKTRSTVYCRC